jgi:hypothetical protein
VRDFGPEVPDRQAFRYLLQNPVEEIERRHKEEIAKYQQAGRLGRWLIARREPLVADYFEFLNAQQSIQDAQRNAFYNEGQDVYVK